MLCWAQFDLIYNMAAWRHIRNYFIRVLYVILFYYHQEHLFYFGVLFNSGFIDIYATRETFED